MKLVFTRDWRGYRAGDQIEVGGGVADEYLRRGVCEVVEVATRAPERRERAQRVRRGFGG